MTRLFHGAGRSSFEDDRSLSSASVGDHQSVQDFRYSGEMVESDPAWRRAVDDVASAAAGPPLDPSVRVTLQFHPDRLVGDRLLLEQLAVDGVYRSQFETGTSNGGLTAHPGGDRWRGESRLFGGAYDALPPDRRPKYGALNHRRRPAGGSARFGSAHFRLTAKVLPRITFCYPDSVNERVTVGTAEHLSLITLPERDESVGRVDVLDDHIEAHVHGPLRLDRDVDALVLDPCYRGIPVEVAAAALPLAVEWHHGFRLSADGFDRYQDYRGRHIPEVARQVADAYTDDGWLHARAVGDAAPTGDWAAQDLKYLWHCLARFGSPAP